MEQLPKQRGGKSYTTWSIGLRNVERRRRWLRASGFSQWREENCVVVFRSSLVAAKQIAAKLARDDIRFISPEALREAEGWEEGFIFASCTKFDFINFDF